MPYKLKGNCVHKENADGSLGEAVPGGCHKSADEAKAHMRALYANVHKSIEGFEEFSMAIVKMSSGDGKMRWRSVNSDTGKDSFGENMSTELFVDMISRIENKTPFPQEFKGAICEEGWCGGMPYVSLAHYKSAGGKNVPGEAQSIYMDGDLLKSKGIMYDTPLGKSVYRTLEKDLLEKRSDNKARISIGFLDLEHTHGNFKFTRRSVVEKCPLCAKGIGDKIYRKGVLVHLALTRKPANPRTDMEVERSMTTKLEDLKSLVDDEEVLADLELKSEAVAEEVLVVRNEDEDADDMKDKKKKKKEAMQEESAVIEPVTETPAPTPVLELTPLQKSLAALETSVVSLKSQGLVGESALQQLQPNVDQLAEVLRAEFTPVPSAEEAANKNVETTLRSLLTEMLPQLIAPIKTELSELRALSLAGKPVQQLDFVPEPRSLTISLAQRSAVEAITKQSSFAALANTSVGLPKDFVRQA